MQSKRLSCQGRCFSKWLPWLIRAATSLVEALSVLSSRVFRFWGRHSPPHGFWRIKTDRNKVRLSLTIKCGQLGVFIANQKMLRRVDERRQEEVRGALKMAGS